MLYHSTEIVIVPPPPPAIVTPRGSPELESGEKQSGERGRACLFVLAVLACY